MKTVFFLFCFAVAEATESGWCVTGLRVILCNRIDPASGMVGVLRYSTACSGKKFPIWESVVRI